MVVIEDLLERLRDRAFENEDAPVATLKQLAGAEAALGVPLPPSYRAILMSCRRRQLPVDLFWVGDPWMKEFGCDLVTRNRSGGYNGLLMIESFDGGDHHCFDLRRRGPDGEYPVVCWDHESDEVVATVASDLIEFISMRLTPAGGGPA